MLLCNYTSSCSRSCWPPTSSTDRVTDYGRPIQTETCIGNTVVPISCKYSYQLDLCDLYILIKLGYVTKT
jgi:hypothetical protein